jgi:hypothetical protein
MVFDGPARREAANDVGTWSMKEWRFATWSREIPVAATTVVSALIAMVLLVALAAFTGGVVASFRERNAEGRPMKANDPFRELVITGALSGGAGGSVIICITSLVGWLNIAF